MHSSLRVPVEHRACGCQASAPSAVCMILHMFLPGCLTVRLLLALNSIPGQHFERLVHALGSSIPLTSQHLCTVKLSFPIEHTSCPYPFPEPSYSGALSRFGRLLSRFTNAQCLQCPCAVQSYSQSSTPYPCSFSKPSYHAAFSIL